MVHFGRKEVEHVCRKHLVHFAVKRWISLAVNTWYIHGRKLTRGQETTRVGVYARNLGMTIDGLRAIRQPALPGWLVDAVRAVIVAPGT